MHINRIGCETHLLHPVRRMVDGLSVLMAENTFETGKVAAPSAFSRGILILAWCGGDNGSE